MGLFPINQSPTRRQSFSRVCDVSINTGLADRDGGADHVGGALLAFGASGHRSYFFLARTKNN